MRRRPKPLAEEIQISGSPVRDDEKARLLPSGAHAGRVIRSIMDGEVHHAMQAHRIDTDVAAVRIQLIECQPGTIGRDARRQADGAEMRYLVLVGSVVVHLPDFFRAAAVGDVIDLAFRDSVDAAAETRNDGIRKLMGDVTGRVRR